jgi:hypothetical protein
MNKITDCTEVFDALERWIKQRPGLDKANCGCAQGKLDSVASGTPPGTRINPKLAGSLKTGDARSVHYRKHGLSTQAALTSSSVVYQFESGRFFKSGIATPEQPHNHAQRGRSKRNLTTL